MTSRLCTFLVGSLLFVQPAVAQAAQAGTDAGARGPTGDRRPSDYCGTRLVALAEIRAADRVDQNLLEVDGINLERDVAVVACTDNIRTTFNQAPAIVEVRAWHKPPDAGWREMRLNEPSVEQAETMRLRGQGEDEITLEERAVRITAATAIDPVITIPLRRDGVEEFDLIRLRVRIYPAPPVPAPAEGQPPATPVQTPAPALPPDNEQVIDTTFRVGRYGLHSRFSDLVLFVQRLGEDRANDRGTSPVVFDQVNFRPAPGVSYVFNYYHRRRALLRFLEPGFGAHLVFLNWNDRPRDNNRPDIETTNVTNLGVGVGVVGSMFDGSVVATMGWNLHVKDQRTYFGLGFSITGLVEKLSTSSR